MSGKESGTLPRFATDLGTAVTLRISNKKSHHISPGQVKNLPLHLRAYASKYLAVPGTYVVVERKKIPILEKKDHIITGTEVNIDNIIDHLVSTLV